MLREPTTLVLGAGASCDFGFPLGEALSSSVYSHCRKFLAGRNLDSFLGNAQAIGAFGANADVRGAASMIAPAIKTVKSVDELLRRFETSKVLVRAVKLCVAEAITAAERAAAVKIKEAWTRHPFSLPTHDGSQFIYRKHWLCEFLIRVFDGVRMSSKKEDIRAALRRIKIVTFNYDRSVEYFFSKFVENAFAMEGGEALALVAELSITHVYGQVAPYDAAPFGNMARQFEHEYKPLTRESLVHISQGAEGLKTIHEASTGSNLEKAKQMLAGSKRILFIGNSFIEQNMEIIAQPIPHAHVMGTACGLSDEHTYQAGSLLTRCFQPGSTPHLMQKWTAWQMIADIVDTL